MSVIEKDTLLKRRENVPFKKMGVDLVILDLHTGDYFSLNDAAGFIWERINGKNLLGSIALKLARAYGISQERALKDTFEFAKLLIRDNLVRIT